MKNVVEMIKRSAEKYPDRIAFGDPLESVSFIELRNRAEKLACYFINENYFDPKASGNSIAFYMEKSVKSVCVMFGAVYCNAFYSYIDTRQSLDRVKYIIETVTPNLIVTDEEGKEKLKDFNTLTIDELICKAEATEIDEELLKNAESCFYDKQPLYVNFTSGSTGVPKGVAVCHASVVDFITEFTKCFDINSEDVIANQAPFDFDVSVKDIYSGLYTGAQVWLIPRSYFKNPTLLMDYLYEKNISVLIWAVTALCFVSIMNGLSYKTPLTIKKVMFSGEVMPVKHLNKWRQSLPDAVYINLYGPTEITCNCTYHIIDREYQDDELIPIGKAFYNEKVFLLDENDKEINSPDIEGEICVAGSCLALGYYKDPVKTAEAFVQNPVNRAYPETMYRTGDLGKYDSEGLLYYTSRKDFQIKHMGQRIELGDIEMAAMSIKDVSRACCLYDSIRSKIVLFCTGSVEKEVISKILREKLPQFMVPGKTVILDDFPMNKNGKIDRKALGEMIK